jgi:hypothetical protein
VRKLYLLFLVTFGAFAQITTPIQPLPGPKGLEDFEHQFQGCPENSECDPTMGRDLKNWRDLITKLQNEKSIPKRTQELEAFRTARGIPVDFYSSKKSQQGFRPLLYNSPCKDHNPKSSEEKTYKGTAFLKAMDSKTGKVWRNDALMEIPQGELLTSQPVVVYYPEGALTYELPLMDQPLFIKAKDLFVLREDEGVFYILKVSKTGDWKIVDLDQTKLLTWEEKREPVKCPAEKIKSSPKAFQNDFCKTVWDEDSKNLVVVKMSEGCAI